MKSLMVEEDRPVAPQIVQILCDHNLAFDVASDCGYGRRHAPRPVLRLDETAPGFSFRLSISRELADPHGCTLAFVRTSLEWKRVVLRLPAAR